jgi:hypothetical protein
VLKCGTLELAIPFSRDCKLSRLAVNNGKIGIETLAQNLGMPGSATFNDVTAFGSCDEADVNAV